MDGFKNCDFLTKSQQENPGIPACDGKYQLIKNLLGFPAPGNDSNEVAPVEQLCLAYAPHLTSKQYLEIMTYRTMRYNAEFIFSSTFY